MKRNRTFTLAAAALTVSVLGGTGFTVANASDSPSTSEVKGVSESEGPGDQAAQDAACKAAGVDPSASNIDYDDETGVCALDNGSDGGSDDD